MPTLILQRARNAWAATEQRVFHHVGVLPDRKTKRAKAEKGTSPQRHSS